MNTILLPMMLVATTLATTPPPITVTPPSVERGTVFAGSRFDQKFTLTNPNPFAIEIVEFRPSCGCQTWTIPNRRIEAGQTTTLTISIGTLAQTEGRKRWTMGLVTRAMNGTAADTTATLEITGLVKRRLMVVPTSFEIHPSDAWYAVSIQPTAVTDLPKLRLGSKPAQTDVEIIPGSNESKVRFRVRSGIGQPVGPQEIVILTDDAMLPSIHLPIEIRKPVPVGLVHTPESWTFSPVSSSDKQSVLFQVRRSDGQPIRVESTRSTIAGIETKFPTGSLPVMTIRVSFDPAKVPTPTGTAEVLVEIAGSKPEMPVETRRIPIRWSIPSPTPRR